MNGEAPIFVVGAPRSGTSLMRAILSRHPCIAICPETHFNFYLYARRRAFGDLRERANRLRAIEAFLALRRIHFLSDTDALVARVERDGSTWPALFACIATHYAASEGKVRWGEKTPQHALFAKTLCEWFPQATIIHMIRDPRDVVASLQCMRWASRSVITNASTWVRCNVAAACSIGPQYLPVRYETLIAEPEQSVARICARVGEEYLPSMLEPARDAPRLSAKAITAERVGAWRRTLTPRQVSQIEWMVGDHMEAFGYAREAKTASPLATAGGLAYALFESFRRRLPQLPGICSHFLAPANLAREEFWLHPDSRRGR